MRESKHRGKTGKGEWVYGSLIPCSEKHSYIVGYFETTEYLPDEDIMACKAVVHKVKKETVGRYTGLPDKNGKDIFEGDIVRHGYSNKLGDFFESGSVVFVINDGAWEIAGEGAYLKRLTRKMIAERNIEIIGNIHDNPELLKENA